MTAHNNDSYVPDPERRQEDRRVEDRLMPLGQISNEQIFIAIARLEGRSDAAAQQITLGMQELHRRIDDKFGSIQEHLGRQDKRLDAIETKVGIAHDNALIALNSAKRAGAISGGGIAALVQLGMELAKNLLHPGG